MSPHHTTPSSFEELAERAEAVAADALRIPPLDLARAMLNEAGLTKARHVLRDGLSHLASKQLELRQAQEEERAAKEAVDTATIAAEWELDGRFEVSGNKTFLVADADCPTCDGDGLLPNPEFDVDEGNECTACTAGKVAVRKPMTADERAKWKATEARKSPEVAEAVARLRSAEHDVAGCRDAVVIADKSLSAARADLDAAVAMLGALVTALPARGR